LFSVVLIDDKEDKCNRIHTYRIKYKRERKEENIAQVEQPKSFVVCFLIIS